MDLKTKLELGWKYLLLIVIAYGIFSFASGHRTGRMHTMNMGHGSGMSWTSDDGHMGDGEHMNIRIEKNMVDGEEVTEVWINGEKQEGEVMEMDGKMMFHTKDGKTINLSGDDDDDEHKIIIKKMKKVKKDKN